MNWLDWTIVSLCIAQFLIYYINIRSQRKFKDELQQDWADLKQEKDKLFSEMAKFLFENRRREIVNFHRWLDQKAFIHIVGDQYRTEDFSRHLTLRDIVEQYLDETTKIVDER